MVDNPELSKFWQASIRSGMLDPGALADCLEGIIPERLTPKALDRRLARQAVACGRITPWQAQQLLLGRWKIPDRHGFWGSGHRYPPSEAEINRFCSQQSW